MPMKGDLYSFSVVSKAYSKQSTQQTVPVHGVSPSQDSERHLNAYKRGYLLFWCGKLGKWQQSTQQMVSVYSVSPSQGSERHLNAYKRGYLLFWYDK